METHQNLTLPQQTERQFYVIFTILCFLIVPIILTGNLLVLVAIVKFKRLRTLPNIFVASLASSDLLVGLLTIPVYVGFLYINPEFANSRWPCTLGYASTVFPIGVSLFSLLAVSVDRYLYIMRPLSYHRYMTVKTVWISVIVIWIYNINAALYPSMGWTNWTSQSSICQLSDVFPFIYSVVILLHVILVLVATTVLYYKIVREAHRQSKRIFIQTLVSEGGPVKDRSGVRLARMFLLVIGLFYIWWSPYLILTATRMMLNPPEPIQLSISVQTSMFLAFCNSFMNPFIYAKKNEQFRVAFKKLLRFRRSTRIKDKVNENTIFLSRRSSSPSCHAASDIPTIS